MLTRIVKMTFQADKVPEFLDFLAEYLPQIRAVAGCTYLEVLQDPQNPGILMTFSRWESEAALENYRHSALFTYVWSRTKIHFAARPEAYSLTALATLP